MEDFLIGLTRALLRLAKDQPSPRVLTIPAFVRGYRKYGAPAAATTSYLLRRRDEDLRALLAPHDLDFSLAGDLTLDPDTRECTGYENRTLTLLTTIV